MCVLVLPQMCAIIVFPEVYVCICIVFPQVIIVFPQQRDSVCVYVCYCSLPTIVCNCLCPIKCMCVCIVFPTRNCSLPSREI